MVQPDPFAETVDNSKTITNVKSADALKAIDGVTKTKYGAATAKAVAVTEKAVKWVKKPTATGGTKAINIAGSVDVASYVYCAVAKSASRLRMLNATKNATAAAKPAVAKAEVLDLTSASAGAKYNV